LIYIKKKGYFNTWRSSSIHIPSDFEVAKRKHKRVYLGRE